MSTVDGAGARTVPAQLATRAAQEPDRVAVRTHGVDELTFARWHGRALAVAAGLRARGVRRGDRIVLHFGARHWVDFAVAYCGVQAAGAVAVPCADRLAPAGLRHVAADCAPVGLLHAAGAAPPAFPAGWVSTVDDAAALAGAPVDIGAVRPGDPAQILYTSGTTGRPKGVVASHANLMAGVATDPRRRPLAHSTHFLHAFPIGTNAAQTMLRNALDARPTALTLPQFTPVRFARLIEHYRVGTVFVVPSTAVELLGSGALDRHDTSSVLLLGSTAAALPPAVAAALAKAFPAATIVNYYTSTEAAPAQTSMVFDPARPDSVGWAPAGSLRVTDPAGRPVPPGTAGEVWLRSPYPRGYHADAGATREVFRDGWVRMGDVGRLDPDGYLYLLDRRQDVVKSGAYKVSTLQVEAAIHEHPAVRDVAVFGVPHPVLGHEVAAALVCAGPLTLAELRAFLVERLSAHEVPTKILTLEHLPRNAGGKVLKRELAALLGTAADHAHPEVGR
ncbi:putative fatty-acid-CoA ligase FadD [Virgisporangium aliadipatigenens]|uniref:Putative fatty-acid-CoA ligase FadD n=1 Tax=Virgisporangium aliadipatigenens TaxID=741659 RepID=A0A8J3YIZ6_9ACTN|nr:class I adenylate-forming enzyme family protein [Virgisporangium aliadipatigenens]GIJ45287.1 putative fatty-acid-CoA ligase FadD [Virgisporangium aliadipatigenens]